jgi:hypothetical protein
MQIDDLGLSNSRRAVVLRDRKPVHAQTDPSNPTRTNAYSAWSKPPLFAKVTNFNVTRHQQSRADADPEELDNVRTRGDSWYIFGSSAQVVLLPAP